MTPKEGAVLWIMDVLDSTPITMHPEKAKEILQKQFPQAKITTKQIEKIHAAYEQEVERIKRKYAQYMKGRGLK